VSVAAQLTAFQRLQLLLTRHAGVRRIWLFVRWLLMLAVTFIGLLGVTFFIGRKIPIDPLLAMLGERASAQAYATARVALGLDKPLIVQFLIYVRDVLHGDLGMSLLTSNPVIDDIKRVFPATLELATLSTFIGIVIGVPLGLAIGKYQRVRDLFMPVVEILRPIPAIAWVPMSIMLWPNNEASIVFITFIGAFFPILLNTIHGVHSLDGVLIRAGRCLGASESRLLLNVILPGSLPHIFTGLAVGMGVAWVSLIAAEMISGQFGVGYFTWEAYSLVNYPAIVLGMITIGVLGLACSGIIRLVGVLMMPWLAFAPGSKQ